MMLPLFLGSGSGAPLLLDTTTPNVGDASVEYATNSNRCVDPAGKLTYEVQLSVPQNHSALELSGAPGGPLKRYQDPFTRIWTGSDGSVPVAAVPRLVIKVRTR